MGSDITDIIKLAEWAEKRMTVKGSGRFSQRRGRHGELFAESFKVLVTPVGDRRREVSPMQRRVKIATPKRPRE